jgi:hypothetical protein
MICNMSSNKTSHRTLLSSPTSSSATDWLQRDSHFSQLTREVDQLLEIQSLLVQQLGLKQLQVVRYHQQVVTVIVPGAAAAAKLRQSEPLLVTHLQQAGWECSRIKARPQTQFDKIDQPAVRFREPLSAPTVRQLSATAGALEDGPIKEALLAIVRHAQEK